MKHIFALLFISITGISQSVSRGPYLQQATPSSIIIKWQTSSATNTKVNYGTSLAAIIQSTIDDVS